MSKNTVKLDGIQYQRLMDILIEPDFAEKRGDVAALFSDDGYLVGREKIVWRGNKAEPIEFKDMPGIYIGVVTLHDGKVKHMVQFSAPIFVTAYSTFTAYLNFRDE